MSDGTPQRVALDLAVIIYEIENRVEVGAEPPINSENAREYWLRLYNQCLEVSLRADLIGKIVSKAKLSSE